MCWGRISLFNWMHFMNMHNPILVTFSVISTTLILLKAWFWMTLSSPWGMINSVTSSHPLRIEKSMICNSWFIEIFQVICSLQIPTFLFCWDHCLFLTPSVSDISGRHNHGFLLCALSPLPSWHLAILPSSPLCHCIQWWFLHLQSGCCVVAMACPWEEFYIMMVPPAVCKYCEVIYLLSTT